MRNGSFVAKVGLYSHTGSFLGFPSKKCLVHESLMIIRPHFISRRPRRTPRMGNQGMEKERHQQQQVKHLGDQPARQSPTRAINELCSSSSSSSSAGHIINIILWFIDLHTLPRFGAALAKVSSPLAILCLAGNSTTLHYTYELLVNCRFPFLFRCFRCSKRNWRLQRRSRK